PIHSLHRHLVNAPWRPPVFFLPVGNQLERMVAIEFLADRGQGAYQAYTRTVCDPGHVAAGERFLRLLHANNIYQSFTRQPPNSNGWSALQEDDCRISPHPP